MQNIAGGILIAVFVISMFKGGVSLLRQDELKWIATLDKILGFVLIILSIVVSLGIVFLH